MSKNKAAFPPENNDPFDCPNNEDLLPTWSTSTETPRWQLLTDQEQAERDKQINKLESKLKRLDQKKDKPTRNYTNEIIPDLSYVSSDNEEDNHVDEEGLPLLWKCRSSDLDQIPRKTEDHFNKSWRSLFSSCCCCF